MERSASSCSHPIRESVPPDRPPRNSSGLVDGSVGNPPEVRKTPANLNRHPSRLPTAPNREHERARHMWFDELARRCVSRTGADGFGW